MRFFRRAQSRNNVLNLFRITDAQYARSFDGVALLELVVDRLAQLTGKRPTSHTANYEKEWKTWDGFARGARRLPELAWAWLSYDQEGLRCEFQNTQVDSINPPEAGSISLMVSAPEQLVSLDQLRDLASAVHHRLPFEYGYAHALGTDHIPGTEARIKKGWFGGGSVRLDAGGSVWLYHMLGIRHGYLRSVYAHNILNASHMANPPIRDLLDRGVGAVRPLNDKLVVWSVPEGDIEDVLEVLAAAGSIIWHKSGRDVFLRQDCARQFHAAMWPKAGGA